MVNVEGASGNRGGGAKVVLIVIGVVALLGVLCCVGVFTLTPAKHAVTFGRDMAQGQMRLDAAFADAVGPDAVYQFPEQGLNDVLKVGVPGGPESEDEVVRLQDAAWRVWAESFDAGAMPIRGVAVGRATARARKRGSSMGRVEHSHENFATVAELERRTGVPAPPVAEFFKFLENMQQSATESHFEPIEDTGAEPNDE